MAGVRTTLAEMERIVKRYKTDPSIYILSRQLTEPLESYDVAGEVAVLHAFVRDRIRYIQDVEGVETLQTPDFTLKCRQGDCDDKSILLNTLLAATGKKTAFIAVGMNGGFYQHVLSAVRLGTRMVPLETIIPGAPMGWIHPEAWPRYTWNL